MTVYWIKNQFAGLMMMNLKTTVLTVNEMCRFRVSIRLSPPPLQDHGGQTSGLQQAQSSSATELQELLGLHRPQSQHQGHQRKSFLKIFDNLI